MKVYQKYTGKAKSMPAGLSMGCLASLALTIGGAWLLSHLLSNELLQWSNIGYGIMTMLFFASASGALIARSCIKRQHLLVSQISAALYFVLLMAITALFFGGQYEAVGVTALLVWGGSTLTILLVPTAKGEGSKRKKYRYPR